MFPVLKSAYYPRSNLVVIYRRCLATKPLKFLDKILTGKLSAIYNRCLATKICLLRPIKISSQTSDLLAPIKLKKLFKFTFFQKHGGNSMRIFNFHKNRLSQKHGAFSMRIFNLHRSRLFLRFSL